MRKPYLVHNIERLGCDGWSAILRLFLARANTYKAVFPDGGEGDLAAGRADCLALDGATIVPWWGMADSSEVSGPLNDAAKALFLSPGLRLWHFELWQNDELVLSLEDFTLCIVHVSATELDDLKALITEPNLLEAINLRRDPGIQPVTMTSEEMDFLIEQLQPSRPKEY